MYDLKEAESDSPQLRTSFSPLTDKSNLLTLVSLVNSRQQ